MPTLRLDVDDAVDLTRARSRAEEEPPPDAVLLLTEIPRMTDRRPLLAEVFGAENIAIVSCPAFGAPVRDSRLCDVIVALALRMGLGDPGRPPHTPRGLLWTDDGEDGEDHGLLLGRVVGGGTRMVLGMVAANAPLRTAPQLSTALAAAAATGAFGVFYSSIWAMALYLSTPRLIGIGLLAIAVMVAWLIAGNRLWDPPGSTSLGRIVLLYNLSTVLTLLLCVGGLYAALVIMILLGGIIVIAPEYMTQIIGQDARFVNYLDIAWLSAAMGVVAGALGTSFDQRTDLRTLTHGQRERSRHVVEEAQGPL